MVNSHKMTDKAVCCVHIFKLITITRWGLVRDKKITTLDYPSSEFKDYLAGENLRLPKVSPSGKKTHQPIQFIGAIKYNC